MKILQRGKYKKKVDYFYNLALEVIFSEYRNEDIIIIVEDSEETPCALYRFNEKLKTPDNIITVDPDRSYKQEWQNKDLSTKARERTKLIKNKKITEGYKKMITLIIDLAHEMGHYFKHRDENGKTTINEERYKKDYDYRLKIEEEAEEEVTKIAKKYEFYDLINKVDFD